MPETAYETVNVERRGAGVIIELNRPDALNAWTLPMGADLLAALSDASSDESVRAVMLTGAGRGFSSGADLLEERGEADLDEDGNFDLSKRLRDHYHPIFHAIRDMPKPVITAVNGPAAGIGCSLALSGDLSIAGESAYFLLAFVNIGLVPDGGSSAFVPAKVGFARAAEMMLLGERIPADKALDWGLVNQVVPDDSLRDEATQLLDRLAAGPTKAYARGKQLLNRRLYADLDGQLTAEADFQREMGRSEDFIEGAMAFAQKRKPEFKGR